MDAKEMTRKLAMHTPTILGGESFSKFAVLLPLVKKEDGIHILFEERAYTLKRQPGDICFPGGRVDREDVNEEYTAIRETMEELGVNREAIGELYSLDYIVTPFKTIIFPFAGFIDSIHEIEINKSEVESVFTVPLSFFIENPPEIYYVNYSVEPDEDFPIDLIVGGKDYQWQLRKMEEHFYRYENRVIWGLTAKMLAHFIDICCRSK
jgi:peroxisomal coenzyme A diphosphatase NUDT7